MYRITRMIAHTPGITPPLQKHTRGYIYIFSVFPPSLYHRGYFEYHTPFRRTPENIPVSKSEYHTRWTPFTHNTHAPVWIPVPARRGQLLRPITVGRSSLWPGLHLYLLLPYLERGSCRFFPRPPHLPVPTLTLRLLPWLKP